MEKKSKISSSVFSRISKSPKGRLPRWPLTALQLMSQFSYSQWRLCPWERYCYCFRDDEDRQPGMPMISVDREHFPRWSSEELYTQWAGIQTLLRKGSVGTQSFCGSVGDVHTFSSYLLATSLHFRSPHTCWAPKSMLCSGLWSGEECSSNHWPVQPRKQTLCTSETRAPGKSSHGYFFLGLRSRKYSECST